MRRRFLTLILILATGCYGQQLLLPNKPDSLRFAVIGDSGTGGREQYQVGQGLAAMHAVFPFQFVLMLGDNLYGLERPSDFETKFERPYKALLDAGVKFYATLGNHDEPLQSRYKLFNMSGERYYTFKPKDGIRFFALDSNYMDRDQLKWLEKELGNSGSEWKIAFFHHPLYASGMHGSDKSLRAVLEPLFVKDGVNVVFSGHEHFYERIKPQRGIYYFVSGGAGKLRRHDIDRRTGLTAKGFDDDNHFMLVEISGNQLYFQTISRTGQTVDSGSVVRPQPGVRASSQAATGAIQAGSAAGR